MTPEFANFRSRRLFMELSTLDPQLVAAVRKAQVDEKLGAATYSFMARREKNAENRRILEQMSLDETRHAAVWQGILKENLKYSSVTLLWIKILTVGLGFTFVVKTLQKDEKLAQASYEQMQKDLPQAAAMLADERRHEKELYAMLDEERLHYVGAMVLGLNDALVELTGAIAGVTFSVMDCKYIALTGIVTGIAATLSMMASNYLAESAEGHKDAFKSSLYTGAAYLVTVALLVLPYLLFPDSMYLWAFIVMICEVIFEIAFFNYYISVAQEQKFFKHFLLMVSISLGVAAISYGIGLLANFWLGVSI